MTNCMEFCDPSSPVHAMHIVSLLSPNEIRSHRVADIRRLTI